MIKQPIKKKWLYSLALNVTIFLMVVIAWCIWRTRQFDDNLTYRYFTTQSNLLIGVVSLIYSIYLILLIKGKINKIPKALENVKLLATTGVTLTLITVVFFLAPVSGSWDLYLGSGWFYHIAIPIASLLSFLLFEHSDNGYFLPDTMYALIHMIAYGVFYCVSAFTHMNPDGSFMSGYDWYTFIQIFSVKWCWVCMLLMIGITYLIAWLLWLGNKKINIFKKDDINYASTIQQNQN